MHLLHLKVEGLSCFSTDACTNPNPCYRLQPSHRGHAVLLFISANTLYSSNVVVIVIFRGTKFGSSNLQTASSLHQQRDFFTKITGYQQAMFLYKRFTFSSHFLSRRQDTRISLYSCICLIKKTFSSLNCSSSTLIIYLGKMMDIYTENTIIQSMVLKQH
jgi:hypothetical protein